MGVGGGGRGSLLLSMSEKRPIEVGTNERFLRNKSQEFVIKKSVFKT